MLLSSFGCLTQGNHSFQSYDYWRRLLYWFQKWFCFSLVFADLKETLSGLMFYFPLKAKGHTVSLAAMLLPLALQKHLV